VKSTLRKHTFCITATNQRPGSSSSLELVQLEVDISNLLKVLTTFSLVSDPNPEGFVKPERYLHATLNVLLRNHG
jgi:hypothetical protein